MGDPNYNNEASEADHLDAAKDVLRSHIADLIGRTDEASVSLRAAMEALLNSGASADQLQAAAAPLILRASEIQSVGATQQAHLIAYVLSEEMLMAEQRRLGGIEAALFDDAFQADLRDAFALGGDDLVQTYDEATERTLDALQAIDAALAEDGLTREERQALLEQRHAVLYEYTGELDALLEEAETRGVEGLEPLAQRVREQREALEASALSPQEREAKLDEASREAAVVAAAFAASDASIILADATSTETDRVLNNQADLTTLSTHAFASNDTTFDALGAFSPPTEREATETTVQLG